MSTNPHPFPSFTMVLATDIITYVGIPLAVLGVMPIMYTFITALYTKSYIRRVLHKNNIHTQIRARLMTGIVEVDLPVFQLEPLHRDEPRYWTKPVLPLSVEGASWNHFNWFMREIDHICSRFHRSDKLVLPESKIDFEKLVVFLMDRGACPSLKGFNALLNRGQQTTVGTVLMDVQSGPEALATPVLTIAKPGERHGSISVKLHWPTELHLRDSASLPLSWIHVPAENRQLPASEQAQRPTSALNEDPIVSGNQFRDITSTNSNSTAPQQYHLYIQIGANSVEDVNIKAETDGTRDGLEPDHLKLFRVIDIHWDAWFACAAIAVFGFKDKRIFRFKPSTKVLYYSREGEIPVRAAFYLNLIDGLRKRGDLSLSSMYSQLDIQPTDDLGQRGLSRLQEHAEKLPKERISQKELWKISKWSTKKVPGKILSYIGKEPPSLPDLMGKYIPMVELLKLCLLFLASHPVQIPSGPVTQLSSKHWDVDETSQKTSESVVRAMALDLDFARDIYSELDNAMAMFMGKREISWEQPSPYRERASTEDSSSFCCAVVLLAVIGKRAAYLLSGEDIENCEKEWKNVYVS